MNGDEESVDCDDVKPRGRWRWLLKSLLIGIAITPLVLGLVFISLLPAMLEHRHNGYRAEVIMNAKMVGLSLFEFENEFGSYPTKATALKIKEEYEVDQVNLGDHSSNDFFRQLMVVGYMDQERSFWTRAADAKKPDNNMEGDEMLKAGECGFSYVVYESSEGLPEMAPLIMTPLIPGKRQFDYQAAKKHFGGKAFLLTADLAVSLHEIDRNGRVMIEGMDFFDPENPHWGGGKPRVVWPE